jgi:hypothetical protein
MKKREKLTQPSSSLSSLIPTLLPLATRGEQGDYFPGIFWHHSAPLVACGASCLPFAKVGLFLMILEQLYGYVGTKHCSNQYKFNRLGNGFFFELWGKSFAPTIY